MEAYKTSMILEMAKLQTTLMAHKRSFIFLISHNDLPTIFCEPLEEKGQIVRGHCHQFVRETFEWPTRIQKLITAAEDRHQSQRQ